MVNQAQLGMGNIPIVLDGNEYILVPSLNATQSLSRQNGGIRGAVDALVKLDFDLVVRVIQLGLGPKVAAGIKNLPEVVYHTGLTDNTGGLAAKCIEYLNVLANGGRPLDVEASQDTQNPPNA